MRAPLLVGTLLAATMGLPPTSFSQTLPASRARMYPRPSREVWQAAQDTLAGLEMKVDEAEADNQMVVTKFRAYGGHSVEPPAITGYRPSRFRLYVFVSPFAEPARVHVGSLSELERMAGGTSTMYNGGEAEAWFLDALERRLGVGGRPIPADRAAREALAAELDGAAPCRASDAADVQDPVKIKASEVKVLYPGGASANARTGRVVVELTIGEDGAVYGATVKEDTSPDQQFRHSALGAASLLRYVPARVKGCPVPTIFTFTYNYGKARYGR